jgi:hypothetical protein
MVETRMKRIVAGVLAAALSVGVVPVNAAREGECAGAQELFPDNNPVLAR